MSKNNKLYPFEQYSKLFKEFVNDKDLRKQNEDLYKMIYNHYKPKMTDVNFDINVERITLNKLSGKHRGFLTNFDINIAVIVVTIFLSTTMQFISSIMQLQGGDAITYLMSLGLIIYLIIDFKRSKSSYKELIYNLCLLTLDDLEKEMISTPKKVILKIPMRTT